MDEFLLGERSRDVLAFSGRRGKTTTGAEIAGGDAGGGAAGKTAATEMPSKAATGCSTPTDMLATPILLFSLLLCLRLARAESVTGELGGSATAAGHGVDGNVRAATALRDSASAARKRRSAGRRLKAS